MKKVFFDTETTGLKPGQIAQLSVIIEEDGKELVAKNYFFKVDYMTDGAAEICGRDTEFYAKASGGKIFADYKDEILKLFEEATLIAHNLKFDENFVSMEFWRQNIMFKPSERFDTMVYFKDICNIPGKNGKAKNPKLEELVDYFKIDKEKVKVYSEILFGTDENGEVGFHDARYDTTSMFVAFQIYKEAMYGQSEWKNKFTKTV